jgi:hypothetical protein
MRFILPHILPEIAQNYNNSRHTLLKDTPSNILRLNDTGPLVERIKKHFNQANPQAIETLLDIGQQVRIINSKKLKSTISNDPNTFSVDIYKIFKRFKSNPAKNTRNRYLVEDADGVKKKGSYNIKQLVVVNESQEAPIINIRKRAPEETALERRIRNRTTEPAPPVEQRVIIGKRRVAESWKAPTKCIESQ